MGKAPHTRAVLSFCFALNERASRATPSASALLEKNRDIATNHFAGLTSPTTEGARSVKETPVWRVATFAVFLIQFPIALG